jgi:Domain of unknown function (DUF1877)
MAITQQLARMNKETFSGCCENSALFVQLVSFNLLSKENYLDLSWAPAGLTTLSRLSGQSYNAQAALYISCNGTQPVHLHIEETWESAFSIQAGEVKSILSGMSEVNLERLLGSIPKEEYKWNQFFGIGEIPDPEAYYRKHFNLLFTFYKNAAECGESVIVWSD